MTPKRTPHPMTEIDDEMVDRAEAAFVRDFIEPGKRFSTMHVRGLLEAALSPPKPEIEVTGSMLAKGVQAYYEACPAFGGIRHPDGIIAAYRAMKAQEGAAYAVKPAPQGVSSAAPVKETGGGVLGTLHCRAGEKKAHQHRRKHDATYVSFFSLDRA